MAAKSDKTIADNNQLTPVQEANVQQLFEARDQLAGMEQQTTDNVLAVARQFNYDGALTVGALEDEIRFYQRRTVEACLELGKRLLILKELTPHGEFTNRVELLGFNRRLAQQFMSATLKFLKTKSTALLMSVDTQSKLLELIVLDDGEIEALENGESVRGVNLDAIESMSVSELKKALRASREDLTAKDDVIKGKNEELDKQAEKLAKLTNAQMNDGNDKVEFIAMPGEADLLALQDFTRTITGHVSASLRSHILKLLNKFEPGFAPKHIELAVAQSLGLIITAAYDVAEDLRIDPALDPDTAAENPAKADAEAFLAFQAEQETEGWTEADDEFFATAAQDQASQINKPFTEFTDDDWDQLKNTLETQKQQQKA